MISEGVAALGSDPRVYACISLTPVHKNGAVNMAPWIYAGTTDQYKVEGPLPVGHAAVVLSDPGEPVWDGTLTYRWDPDARQYYSLPLTVKIHSLDEYSQVAVPIRAAPVVTYTVATAKYVHFPEHRTSVADGGFCWICEQDAAGVFSMGELSHAGVELSKSIPCILRGARTTVAGDPISFDPWLMTFLIVLWPGDSPGDSRGGLPFVKQLECQIRKWQTTPPLTLFPNRVK